MHRIIFVKFVRYRISRDVIRTFNDGSIQQSGIFIQQAHSTISIKGKSGLASKKRVSSDLDSMSTIATTTKRNKVNTPRASNKEYTCPFQMLFFCQKYNNKWYIRSQTDNFNNFKVGVHSQHLQIQPNRILNKVDHLDDAVHIFIQNFL